jgi:L-ascorbate metabolism protein UlaG (beta-lactamase superfamily)
MLTRNRQRAEKKQDNFRLTPSNDTTFQSHKNDCIIWLGHASFFIRLNGINILMDPVFFKIPFVRRYAEHAFTPNTFNDLHYLMISHDHQDHCQEKSIRNIVDRNPNMEILTGLNMETLLRLWSKNLSMQMAGWYQQYNTSEGIEIYYLPSRHWSKRGLRDDNKRLWGAFVIRSKDKTIYFSGDSGYGSHFSEVKNLFKKIDVAIIGIGAYKPEWFMHPNHVSPTDAVKAFHDLEAKIFIPMHYGTFDISDEPIGEPLRVLLRLRDENKINGRLVALNPGENFTAF